MQDHLERVWLGKASFFSIPWSQMHYPILKKHTWVEKHYQPRTGLHRKKPRPPHYWSSVWLSWDTDSLGSFFVLFFYIWNLPLKHNFWALNDMVNKILHWQIVFMWPDNQTRISSSPCDGIYHDSDSTECSPSDTAGCYIRTCTSNMILENRCMFDWLQSQTQT